MGEFWLATGVLFIPFGFWLIVEYPQNKSLGVLAVGIGIICWFTAWWMIRTKEKKEQQEELRETEKSHRLLEAILGELKRSNQNKG